MRLAEQVQIAFVSLSAALAWIRPMPSERRLKISGLTIAMIFILCAGRFSARALGPTQSTRLRDWLPAALFLVPYWQIGNFFTGPKATVQEQMILPKRRSCGSIGWNLYGEVIYLLVYPLIPLGLNLPVSFLIDRDGRIYAKHTGRDGRHTD
jgi:hypothetical protein